MCRYRRSSGGTTASARGMQGGSEYMLVSAAGIHSVQAQHLGLDETSAGLGGPSPLSTAARHSRAGES